MFILKRFFLLVSLLFFSFAFGCSKNQATDKYGDLRERLKELKQKNVSEKDFADHTKVAAEYEELSNIIFTAYENKHSALKNLGVKLLQRQMYDPAIDALQKAAAVKSDDADLYYYIGIGFGYKGKTDPIYNFKSEEYYNKALQLQPDNHLTLYALSILYYFNMGNKQQGFEIMKKARSVAKVFDYKIPAMLGKYYYDAEDYKSAIEFYNESLEKTNNNIIRAKLLFDIGKIYHKFNDTKSAAEYFRKAADENPKDEIIKNALTQKLR